MGGEKRVDARRIPGGKEARRPAPKKGGPGLEACQGCKQKLGEPKEGRKQGEEGGCRTKR
jgi:hypothetical protein